jgi:isopenicillin-N N-acyltransferase-like protein
MIDAGFPLIRYAVGIPPRDRGRQHGESFRAAIAELAAIRRDLMIQKNPGLTPAVIRTLAAEQWSCTLSTDRQTAEEIEGIAEGADCSIESLVILNNYTDFRDIHVADQGCSVIFVNRDRPLAGQTWDMHSTAKNYVCCLQIEAESPGEQQVLFSLVGCVGLMGYNGQGLMVGVNNINTDGARPGILWPMLVRQLLRLKSLGEIRRALLSAPITSGHTYLIASRDAAEFWEVMPGLAEPISRIALPDRGHLFHTNHCLGANTRKREVTAALSSTTHVRYGLLEKKIGDVDTFDDAYRLLNDHENYPMAICSNYQSGALDPSVTCGGALGDLSQGSISMWRGDELYDRNFVRRDFQLTPVSCE